jgi:hypothetical protein
VLFGPYEPDKPANRSPALADIANAYPGANGYRPVGQFQAITAALPGPFSNATAFINSAGNGVFLAGTLSGIYRYSGSSWSALATGLTFPNRWNFTQFGDLAICVNGGVTKKVDLVANSIADVTGAPTALLVATVRDFVVYGQAGGDALMVQWSGFNNADSNVPGTNQAGFQPMLAGGHVMGLGGGEFGIIVQRSRVVRMSYTGDPDNPFQFDAIAENIGAVSRGSVAQVGRDVYFLSDEGFMRCDGNQVVPIGVERVDRMFSATYPRSTLEQMYAAGDPRRNVVTWTMPGSPGMTLLYDYALDRWSALRTNLVAAFSGFSSNLSLDDLDALYPGGVDTIPYSFDDPRFAGGDPLFLMVDISNVIGTLSGANMAAYFTCAFQELAPGLRARVKKVRPLGDAAAGLTVTLDCRARLGDAAGTKAFGTMTASGLIPVRANARYIAPRLDVAAGADWTFQQGLEFDIASGGAR